VPPVAQGHTALSLEKSISSEVSLEKSLILKESVAQPDLRVLGLRVLGLRVPSLKVLGLAWSALSQQQPTPRDRRVPTLRVPGHRVPTHRVPARRVPDRGARPAPLVDSWREWCSMMRNT
jgi:hypothetical protein